MLGSLILYLKGMRIMMFQLSGFYYIVQSYYKTIYIYISTYIIYIIYIYVSQSPVRIVGALVAQGRDFVCSGPYF